MYVRRCVRRKAVKRCQLISADRVGTAVLYTRGRAMAVFAFPWSTPVPKGVVVGATSMSLYTVPIVYHTDDPGLPNTRCQITLYDPPIAVFTLARCESYQHCPGL